MLLAESQQSRISFADCDQGKLAASESRRTTDMFVTAALRSIQDTLILFFFDWVTFRLATSAIATSIHEWAKRPGILQMTRIAHGNA